MYQNNIHPYDTLKKKDALKIQTKRLFDHRPEHPRSSVGVLAVPGSAARLKAVGGIDTSTMMNEGQRTSGGHLSGSPATKEENRGKIGNASPV